MQSWLIFVIAGIIFIIGLVFCKYENNDPPKTDLKEEFDPNAIYGLNYARVYPGMFSYYYFNPNGAWPALGTQKFDAFNPSVNRNSDYGYIPMHESLDRWMNGNQCGPSGCIKNYPTYRNIKSNPIIFVPPVDGQLTPPPNILAYQEPSNPVLVPPIVDPACVKRELAQNSIIDVATRKCTIPEQPLYQI